MSDMKGISSQEIAKSLRQCTVAGGGSNACAECALHGMDFEQDCFDELNCMAASAIEGLQAQLRAVEYQWNALLEENRWIPVTERNPDSTRLCRFSTAMSMLHASVSAILAPLTSTKAILSPASPTGSPSLRGRRWAMTELIAALKHCAHASSCEGCPLEGLHEKSGLPGMCADVIKHRAAEAIEGLTTWRDPVKDPPARFEPVLVCRVKDPAKPPIVEQGFREPGGWWKVYGTRVKKIIGWMPMPEGMEVKDG